MIEVAIAVFILASAMTVLISAETRAVSNLLREKNAFRAALYGQYIIAIDETDLAPPDPGTKTTSLMSELSPLGYRDDFPPKSLPDESWKITRQVTSIDLGPMRDVLRRIDITIAWGNSSLDQIELTSFIKVDQTQSTQ